MESDRTNKLRAGLIRDRLLRGVPPESALREIVLSMSDDELIRRENEETARRITLITEKRRKRQESIGKIVA